MNVELHKSIDNYFRAANAHDGQLLEDCFAEDAVVHDEGEVFCGIAAIKKWLKDTSEKYEIALKIISATQEDGETIVTTQASGNFQGSPTSIEFHFIVKNQKITALRCG